MYFGRGSSLLYEVVLGSTTDQRHYIYANGAVVAQYTMRSSGVNDTRYFYRDHLGSITLIADETANVTERLSYDANGKRRFTTGADDTGNTLAGNTTDLGFTGHEQLEEIGLIHMNGRLYDPRIGRFISADPIGESKQVPGGLNRYSYVLNNPFVYVDPTGYGSCDSVITCHTWWISAPGTSGKWVDASPVGGCETCLVDDGDPGPGDSYWGQFAGPSTNPTARPSYTEQLPVLGRRPRFEIPSNPIDVPPGEIGAGSVGTNPASRNLISRQPDLPPPRHSTSRGDCQIARTLAGILRMLDTDAASLGIPVGNTPFGVPISVDRDGRWYVGGSVGTGYPRWGLQGIFRDPPGFNFEPRNRSEDLQGFIQGPALNIGGILGFIVTSDGWGWTVQNPGVGVSYNFPAFCGE